MCFCFNARVDDNGSWINFRHLDDDTIRIDWVGTNKVVIISLIHAMTRDPPNKIALLKNIVHIVTICKLAVLLI